MKTARNYVIWACIGIAVTALALGIAGWSLTRPTEHRVFVSPDSRFRLVVYKAWPLVPTMPGQGSDAAGVVRLIDARSGRVLNAMPAEMVQLVDPVEWRLGHVSVRLLFDWQLPP